MHYYAQLVQDGKPKLKEKNAIGYEVVGLDIGPSSIAIVSATFAFLNAFCASLEIVQEQIKHIQKYLDRSRRATNKNNFNKDGTIKGGPKKWLRSKRYSKAQAQLSELQRRMAETRKRLHVRYWRQSRHRLVHCTCPLLGVKRTCRFALQMSANDPKRTLLARRPTPFRAVSRLATIACLSVGGRL